MRKRKAPVVWLPLDVNNRLGVAEGDPAPDGATSGWLIGSQEVPPFDIPTTPTVNLFPLVKDEPQGIEAATTTLSDLEGSSYRLRRVVGKIFVHVNQFTPTANSPTLFLTTCGLIVLRVGQGGAELQTPNGYDVAALDAVRDPWIWRRSWAIGTNQQADDTTRNAFPIYPSSNVYAGSVADGPHIDAKTARVISDEERLFLVWSTVALDGNAQVPDDTQQLFLFADLRILATMRKQSGNRRNASR